jgi:hypothetical protein
VIVWNRLQRQTDPKSNLVNKLEPPVRQHGAGRRAPWHNASVIFKEHFMNVFKDYEDESDVKKRASNVLDETEWSNEPLSSYGPPKKML